ncbi:MAG: SUF system NifU family Fe-S cluster assembly protein [Alphaproteobacteria bacterium]|nr:SUF system NifU family Fe-S cluster assembly protein [Alphaproteobacteria bacterium]
MQDELRDLYQEVILDHGKHPRNLRHPADANRRAEGHNPMCGDQLTVFLKVSADGTVEDAAFEGQGCAISVASASMMTEILKGKSAAQAHALFSVLHSICTGEEDGHDHSRHNLLAGLDDEMDRLVILAGVREFPVRVKCATLAWHTMVAAIDGQEAATTE